MIKFGVKVGIAAGACYYLAEEGVWKESAESVKLYDKINDAMKPLLKEIPIEIPDLPNSSCMSYMVKQCWNSGVMTTFDFLRDMPDTVSELSRQGVGSISNNPELKKFISSFNAPPAEEPKMGIEKSTAIEKPPITRLES